LSETRFPSFFLLGAQEPFLSAEERKGCCCKADVLPDYPAYTLCLSEAQHVFFSLGAQEPFFFLKKRKDAVGLLAHYDYYYNNYNNNWSKTMN